MDNKSILVVMDIQEGFLGDNPKLPIKNENKNLFLNGIEQHLEDHDGQIHAIFEAIRRLMTPPEKPRKKIYPVNSMSPPLSGVH